jgi:hypothetical protein
MKKSKMKKLILFTFLLFTTVQFAVAQSAITKLKFQDAEEAYANKDYYLALSKLDEVEKILKSTNPKILYLRILIQSKAFRKFPDNYHSLGVAYDKIQDIIVNTDKYLKDYEDLPDNEDKYRDIYKISETFKAYPATKEAFAAWGKPLLQFNIVDLIKKYLNVVKLQGLGDFKFEITPGDYNFIKINGKKYNLTQDLFPFNNEMTLEQYINRCKLMFLEDGTILFNGKVFLKFESKEVAKDFEEKLEWLEKLAYSFI